MPAESDDTEILDTQEWLLRHLADMPYEELDSEFQRGYFGALLNVYEAHQDADLDDPRYRKASDLYARMCDACHVASALRTSAPRTTPEGALH